MKSNQTETVLKLRLIKDCVFNDQSGHNKTEVTGTIFYSIIGLINGHYYQGSIGAIYKEECEIVETIEMTFAEYMYLIRGC